MLFYECVLSGYCVGIQCLIVCLFVLLTIFNCLLTLDLYLFWLDVENISHLCAPNRIWHLVVMSGKCLVCKV